MPVIISGTSGITSDTGFAADGVSFADNAPANTLVTTSSGNVGVGTSSPNSTINVVGPQTTFDTNVFGQLLVRSTTAFNATPRAGIVFSMKYNSAGNFISGGSSIQGYKQTANDGEFANGLLFTTQAEGSAPAERARIDASGNLLVGKQAADDTTQGFRYAAGAYLSLVRDQAPPVYLNRLTSNGAIMEFARSSVTVGSVSVTTTATAYNTSSDYRLKQSIEPMQNALARNALLNPVKYKWKIDGSDGEGFIAHELQTAFPAAVTGEKDAVDSEGKPVYQGIGTGPLDGHFAACVNELQAIIQSLTQRISALEGASNANTGVPA